MWSAGCRRFSADPTGPDSQLAALEHGIVISHKIESNDLSLKVTLLCW
jgi:hypothetical protein